MLPNFICPGAMKSGTSTLNNVLIQHPDIFINIKKELRFFSNENWTKGLDWYKNQFTEYNGEKIVGDVSPQYLYTEEAPERIYNTLGKDVKFIILLRNPADRAFSQYRMDRRSSLRKGPLKEFGTLIREEIHSITEKKIEHDSQSAKYVAMGLYAKQIKALQKWYDRKNILVIIFDELIHNKKLYYQQMFRFLGVDPDVKIDMDIKSYADFEPKNLFVFRWTLKIIFYFCKFLRLFLPKNVCRKIWHSAKSHIKDRARNSGKEKPTISSDDRRYLMDFYEEDIKELEKMIGKDLSVWTNKK